MKVLFLFLFKAVDRNPIAQCFWVVFLLKNLFKKNNSVLACRMVCYSHLSDRCIRVCISHQSYHSIWVSCTNRSVWVFVGVDGWVCGYHAQFYWIDLYIMCTSYRTRLVGQLSLDLHYNHNLERLCVTHDAECIQFHPRGTMVDCNERPDMHILGLI